MTFDSDGFAPNRPSLRQRICLVTHSIVGRLGGWNGAATAAAALAETLAKGGHSVTLLHVINEPESGKWADRLRQQGVQVVALPELSRPMDAVPHAAWSYRVYAWLRQQTFDIVHFQEWQGHGYYSLLAKGQGLAFERTTLCVTLQGPTLRERAARGEFVEHLADLEVDFLERESVARADVLFTPNQHLLGWLREQGWRLPARCLAGPDLLPPGARIPHTPPAANEVGVRELVFFGPLDARGGLPLFCDAIDRLAALGTEAPRLAFMGPLGTVGEQGAAEYLARRSEKWAFAHRLLPDMHEVSEREFAAALAYLRGEGRLAVLPPPAAHAPHFLSACLHAGVPVLASHVGGAEELFAEADRARVLFPPSAQALAECLARALAEKEPPRPRAHDGAADVWLSFHAAAPVEPTPAVEDDAHPLVSVCMAHFNRPELLKQALASLERQDYPNFEVVLVDDGSTKPEALAYLTALEPEFARRGWRIIRQANRYLGAARNTAARHARGSYLLFMDDDNCARASELSTFVRAARSSGADILTCAMQLFAGTDAPDERNFVPSLPMWVPLGGAVGPGALTNCFGDANALMRKETFFALGGFTEQYGVGHEDWEFFARAVLRGYRLDVVPEPLFFYRVTGGSMIRSTSRHANFSRNLRPYLQATPPELRGLIQLLQGFKMREDRWYQERTLRGDLRDLWARGSWYVRSRLKALS